MTLLSLCNMAHCLHNFLGSEDYFIDINIEPLMLSFNYIYKVYSFCPLNLNIPMSLNFNSI